MANQSQSRKENIEGSLFVDSTCIDCETCRWLAPDFFRESGGQSAVYKQPRTESEWEIAAQALVSCPTSSIGLKHRQAELIRDVASSFPLLIEDDVYYCGYHSEKSFGAASYFIKGNEGNILIDCPRFAKPLVKELHARGGVAYMYLTHRDDVADHKDFAAEFGLKRILHEDDVTTDTRNVEIILHGSETFSLNESSLVIPVPGHTKGHTVLLYKNKFLFTGDHLAFSSYRKHLVGFRNACWYSWSEQIKSMEKLVDYSFSHLLPGHGGRYYAQSSKMKSDIMAVVEWMKQR